MIIQWIEIGWIGGNYSLVIKSVQFDFSQSSVMRSMSAGAPSCWKIKPFGSNCSQSSTSFGDSFQGSILWLPLPSHPENANALFHRCTFRPTPRHEGQTSPIQPAVDEVWCLPYDKYSKLDKVKTMGTCGRINAIWWNTETNLPNLVDMCGYELPTNMQNFTQKDLAKRKYC